MTETKFKIDKKIWKLVKFGEVVFEPKETCKDNGIIGRLGGDEFIVVTPNDLPSAKVLAEIINNKVNNIQTVVDNLHCSVSIGLATIKTSTQDIRTWFEAADKALYEAKKKGRNTLIGKYLD